MWDEITYPFPYFIGATVEVWELISYFIPHFTRHVITYPYWLVLLAGQPEITLIVVLHFCHVVIISLEYIKYHEYNDSAEHSSPYEQVLRCMSANKLQNSRVFLVYCVSHTYNIGHPRPFVLKKVSHRDVLHEPLPLTFWKPLSIQGFVYQHGDEIPVVRVICVLNSFDSVANSKSFF